jgi:hypothetical protein
MGILRTPGEVAAQPPTPKLYRDLDHWRRLCYLGALSVAELGAMIPRSGGWAFSSGALETIRVSLSVG